MGPVKLVPLEFAPVTLTKAEELAIDVVMSAPRASSDVTAGKYLE
jgi:hypothetical protein